MKSFASVIVLCLLLTQGCAGPYIKHSEKAGVDLSKYNSVFIAWIDLPSESWFELGYSSSEDWKNVIIYINKHFQKSAKDVWYEYMDIPISFADNSGDKPSTGNGLYIRFDGAKIVDAYFLYTSVQFIDLKDNSILFEIPPEYYYGGRFRNFENRLIDGAGMMFDSLILKEFEWER